MQNKVIIITGASSGIGAATARSLAAKGAHVALCARRLDKLQSITSDITSGGAKASAHQVDVTSKDQLEKLVESVVEQHGRLDVMVNNAGLMSLSPLSLTKTVEWDQMIDINVKGLLYGIAAALPVFQRQQSGHFINLSSIVGFKVFSPGGVVYSATKFAVRAISEGLRHEVGGKIRTTLISPGAVASAIVSGTSDEVSRRSFVEYTGTSAISADAIASAIAYAIDQPDTVDVNEIVIRPTAQGF